MYFLSLSLLSLILPVVAILVTVVLLVVTCSVAKELHDSSAAKPSLQLHLILYLPCTLVRDRLLVVLSWIPL